MKLNIGENIRGYRKKADMTQEQLADKLGVSYQSVSRWENCSTYPDMELIPLMAKIFGVSIDELFNIPNDKKEQASKEAFERLAAASREDPVDVEKVNALIRDIRINYIDSVNFWRFQYDVKNSVYRMPEILPEVRLLAETVLCNSAGSWERSPIIEFMARNEDDEHISEFLNRYSSSFDISKNALLRERYRTRNQWDKDEPLRQLFLFQHIDQLIGNSELWGNLNNPPDLDKSILKSNFALSLLYRICAQTPDENHPISVNGEVDLWVTSRLGIGFEKASCLAAAGNTEEAFLVLCDTVSLLEKVMQITAPVELRCSSPWLDTTVWTAKEDWDDPAPLILY